jgi:hypothetical protein
VFIYTPFGDEDSVRTRILTEAIEFTEKIGLGKVDDYSKHHAFTNLGDDKTTSEVYVSAVVERLLPLLKNNPE